MAASGVHQETEIKLRLGSAAEGRRLLRRAGFRIRERRSFEDNFVFDTAEKALRRADKLLRLRVARGRSVLTYKGPSTAERYKSRQEIETSVGQAETAEALLLGLGFLKVFRYQKFRAVYAIAGEPGVVALDETPIGVFLEAEGPPEWIDRTATALGFGEQDYVTASYGRLYLDHCAALGLPPADMMFHPA